MAAHARSPRHGSPRTQPTAWQPKRAAHGMAARAHSPCMAAQACSPWHGSLSAQPMHGSPSPQPMALPPERAAHVWQPKCTAHAWQPMAQPARQLHICMCCASMNRKFKAQLVPHREAASQWGRSICGQPARAPLRCRCSIYTAAAESEHTCFA
eukprot:359463-Chlamydomonas_euryale.AAC.1